jgi:plasmid stabilization system protein ParE
MAEIGWTEEAQRWLNDIFEYIAADNPPAAVRTIEGIYERAQDLRKFPELGSRYAASPRNVRILLYGHYRIAYLVKSEKGVGVDFRKNKSRLWQDGKRKVRHRPLFACDADDTCSIGLATLLLCERRERASPRTLQNGVQVLD